MSKKFILIISLVVIVLLGVGLWKSKQATKSTNITSNTLAEKLYVAVEGEGAIAVLGPTQRTVLKRINLSDSNASFMPHNVQISPNGKSVWVTANAMSGEGMAAHDNDNHGDEALTTQDQVIVIDPNTDEVIKRIPLASNLHLSHVVISPDNSFALVASQEQDKIYKINTNTFSVDSEITLTAGSGPHGLRLAPDGKTAYVALLSGKSLGVVDLESFAVTYVSLDGRAVQTGVTPDGTYAVVSVYDSKSLGVYDTATKQLSYVRLPEGAKGPVQLYPTPDSQYIYIADQGYYFDQPNSDKVYKVDLKDMKIVQTITAGLAPHGIVSTWDGKYVYVTNLLSDDVSVIDTSSDKEIARIPVGKQPNGISVWSAHLTHH